MLRVAVIGAGRLAWNLMPRIIEAGNEVSQLISRDEEKLKLFQKTFDLPNVYTQFNALDASVDIVFLTVSDKAIEPVAHKLASISISGPIFVHTSGSISLDAIEVLGARVGVFYPLQIFTFDRQVAFRELPIFLEGERKVWEVLKVLADQLSNQVYQMDSEARLRLHMGAVIACNFPNFLWKLAKDQLPKEVGLSVYESLVRETTDKAFSFGPENTQTGPAVRGDFPTLNKHLDLLKDIPEVAEMYRNLSRLINPDLDL